MYYCMPVAALVLVAAPAAANAPVPPDAVAIVNGIPVSRAAFEDTYVQTKKQYARQFAIDFASEQGKTIEKDLKKGLVDQLIERQIILNEAKSRDIQVSDQDVQDKIAEIQDGFLHEQAFRKALKDNHMTLDELKTRVRDGLLVEGVQKAVASHVVVTDEDVKAYYADNLSTYQLPEEVKASHILIKNRAKATDILAKLKAGANFAALAKEHSEDPGSAAQGGNLGYFGKGRMVREFEKSAFSLKPGQMSDLVKSQFGYHIIKVADRRPARTRSFAEVANTIRKTLLKERRGTAFGGWLQATRAKAAIVIAPEFAEFQPPSFSDQ